MSLATTWEEEAIGHSGDQEYAGQSGSKAATTLLSGGLSTATKIAGKTASEPLLAAERFAHMEAEVKNENY